MMNNKRHSKHRRSSQRTAGCLLLLAFGALLFCGRALGAGSARWMHAVMPVFNLVATSGGEDENMPTAANVEALAQDGTGFIWIGSATGLQRWDGYRMRTYATRPGDPCSLPADSVFSLYTDDRRRLWIGMFGAGLARYDPDSDCIRPVAADSAALRAATVDSMVDDGQGGLWVGTTSGLVHLDAGLKRATLLDPQMSDQGALSRARIYGLIRDRSGTLWVSWSHGLARLSHSGTHFESVALAPGAQPRALLEASDGRIWVGTVSNGAYVIDPVKMRARAINSGPRGQSLPVIGRAVESPTGEVWLGTLNAGIWIVDPVSLRIRQLRHEKGVQQSITDDLILSMLRDRDGLIWVATENGLGYFSGQRSIQSIVLAQERNSLPEGLITDMARLEDDRMAIGTGAQIALIAPLERRAERLALNVQPAMASVVAIAAAGDGNLLIGGPPTGLIRMDLATGRSMRVAFPSSPATPHIQNVKQDGNRIWVGGEEGLWVIDRPRGGGATLKALQAIPYPGVPEVQAIAVGPGALRWFGGAFGLYSTIRGAKSAEQVRLSGSSGDQLSAPYITALLSDRQGRLWVGTVSHGLLLVDGSAIATHRLPIIRQFREQLPGGMITGILEDRHGAIWVSTEQGISRIEADSWTVRRFTRGDGVALIRYASGSCADAACEDLLFGGWNGLTLIRTAEPMPSRPPPTVVITRLSAGHREVAAAPFNRDSGAPLLEVPAQDRTLSVEFSALDYSDPAHEIYAYQLEGYDQQWSPAESDGHKAMYMNLPPGTYRLHLRGSDHAGTWSPRERILRVKVLADWYQTMWFHALELLALALAVFLIVQARTAILRSEQRKLEGLVADRTSDLIQATEARQALIENLAHDLRTPLTSMRAYLERLSLRDSDLPEPEREQCISIAMRQADRLTRLVRELFDLVRLNEAEKNLKLERFAAAELVQDLVREFAPVAGRRTISFECKPGAEGLALTADISLFQRMVENLIDNAAKHTSADGAITVGICAESARFVLSVRDDGRGIDPRYLERIFDRYERANSSDRSRGAGLGLAIVKRIVDLHRGSISVESRVNQGTCFTVSLPLCGPGEPSATS